MQTGGKNYPIHGARGLDSIFSCHAVLHGE